MIDYYGRRWGIECALRDTKDLRFGMGMGTFPGLVRYTVAKLTDGRIAIFNSFDSQENARKSSEEAKGLRAKSGSKLARVLPSDPEILEGTVIGTYPT